jgi:hypothetical protein
MLLSQALTESGSRMKTLNRNVEHLVEVVSNLSSAFGTTCVIAVWVQGQNAERVAEAWKGLADQTSKRRIE